ncbi:MAG TPA: tetratricopeptide repeat protein, partial [Candidatus Kapabacteria bacterium]|nr:tetratricopeptide repeat protein [Candidatus Kapabacteria bacterium]
MEFFDSYNEPLHSEPHESYLDGLRESLNKADADAIRSSASTDTLEELIQYCLEHEKFSDALRFADVLLELLPYSGDVWQKRGIALNELDRNEEALEAFNHALALNPADDDLLTQVAAVHCDTGNYETAMEYIER